MASAIAPFCMDGHRYLHMMSRIPGDDIDKIVSFRNEKPRHVVVCRQGKFYHVEVVSKDGSKILPPKEIKQQLEKVVEMAGDEQDETGVAAFTALPRAKWAQVSPCFRGSPSSLRYMTSLTRLRTYIELT